LTPALLDRLVALGFEPGSRNPAEWAVAQLEEHRPLSSYASKGVLPMTVHDAETGKDLYTITVGAVAGGRHPADRGDDFPAELSLERIDADTGETAHAYYARHPDPRVSE